MLVSEGDLDRVHLAMKVQDRAPYWFWILLWLEVHFEALLLGLCPTVLGVPPVNNTYENPDVRDGRHPQRFSTRLFLPRRRCQQCWPQAMTHRPHSPVMFPRTRSPLPSITAHIPQSVDNLCRLEYWHRLPPFVDLSSGHTESATSFNGAGHKLLLSECYYSVGSHNRNTTLVDQSSRLCGSVRGI